ncbi:Ig-like domain-containing protein [Mycolicibacterium sp. P1-5]|uniref:beta strand repeat-containing protein n=1 Tax=Mycolicibacterium sp. P1-5 TaxID=2024617 RepID=UPI0011EE80DB|nr:Ig-like domain-containing protein [Mycolicibacterium sp. P1-5]KAA0111904.1 hypothetical protein CIW47_01190 [Mycolicibacterium sp. P1-5]
MAAASPRKPRATTGRHRKSSTFHVTACAQWLGVGAVGFGLAAAAVAGGGGTASASTDEATAGPPKASERAESAKPSVPARKSGSKRPTATKASPQRGEASAPVQPAGVGPGKRSGSHAPPSQAMMSTALAGESAAPVVDSLMPSSPNPASVLDAIEAVPTRLASAVQDVLSGMKIGPLPHFAVPGVPVAGFDESAWLAALQSQYAGAAHGPANVITTSAPPRLPNDMVTALQNAVTDAVHFATEVSEQGAAFLHAVSSGINNATTDFINSLTGAGNTAMKSAAAVKTASAADTPAYGTPEFFVSTLQTVLNQLVGWPEPPTFDFVTSANYLLDQALDAHDAMIDLVYANPTPATRWIPDLMSLVHLFFQPFVPNYTFSDGLNVLGSLLNRVVPPYKIRDPQSATLTETQVAAAAVGALVKVLDRLLLGDFDPTHWRDAAIEGGTAGLTNPASVLNMTFTTGAQPNLFSLMAYVALVAVYKRFQWVALDHLPVVTGNTQTGQLLITVSGKVTATDPEGDPLTYTATQAAKGFVTVGPDGTWTYTRTSDWSRSDTDSFTIAIDDSLGQITTLGLDHPYAPDGHSVTVTVNVNYTGTTNTAPVAVGSAGLPDGMGVVRGRINAFDMNGNALTYSLVNPGTSGATTSSIYTTEGGIVQLDSTSGEFTYIPKVSTDFLPGLDTDTFQVQVSDGQGGTATASVVVLSNLTAGTTTTSTSASIENGKVDVPSVDAGLLTYSLGTGPAKGTVVVNADGTYTYTRSVSATGSTSDTFTIIGIDANGKTVTLPSVSVAPPLVNVTPATAVSGGTFTPRTVVGGVAILPGTQTTTGTFSGVDAGGHPVTVAAGIYGTSLGGTVTVLSGGGFLYSFTSFGDAWHKAAADNAPVTDKFDTVQINVTDSLGGVTAVTFAIALRTENDAPSSSTSVGGADGLGVVRGSVSGSDTDGDSFAYSLAGVGNPSGGTATSTYTTKGGIVSLNSDGTFTYIPTKSASTSDSFTVSVSDGHGGTTSATVNVPLGTPSPLTNVDTATLNTVTGKLNIPGADNGLMTYSLGTGPSKGSVTVNPDGSFSYARTAGLGHTTTPADSFTIVGTEVATGKTVTIATVNVTPTVANALPAGGSVTVGSSSLTTGFTRDQTTTGVIHASDPDGDALTFTAGTFSTVNGGSITVAADGSFTYTISKGLLSSYYHDAAKIGAIGNAVGDSVNVTVSDAFGASTTFTAVVPIYATNTGPTLSSGVRWAGSNLLGTYTSWTSVSGSDGDSDSLSYAITQQPAHGSANYDSFLNVVNTSGTQTGDTTVLAVYDGYYVVSNGVVTGTPASYSVTLTAQQNA